ncbi:hypothetical protein JTE90_000803 [Oedothorax gibbosus]|uniref:Ig-like domain-containing protein n=1 Tax=Oedothorax gibbosus TaxID=931172 RepID=A0AAV6U117_9ARAC|nr:hypothetical protein JTE90_000803 [Oedothorax gibbosus]
MSACTIRIYVRYHKRVLFQFLPNFSVPQLSRSNATRAFLHSSYFPTEGLFGSEVSVEMPHFRTIKAEKEMLVYELPEADPSILGVHEWYAIGSAVNVTCVFGPSKPAAHLTWYIDGEKAPDAFVTSSALTELSFSVMSSSRLSFAVDRYRQGRHLSVRCEARVSLVHSRSSAEIVVRERARLKHGKWRKNMDRIRQCQWNRGLIKSVFLSVVPHVPPGMEGPSIEGAAARYSVGDFVHVNCSSAKSEESSQLQWYVNENQAQPEFLIEYPPVSHPDSLSSSRVGLRVRPEHLAPEEGLRCEATLAHLVTRGAEATLLLGTARREGEQSVQDNGR